MPRAMKKCLASASQQGSLGGTSQPIKIDPGLDAVKVDPAVDSPPRLSASGSSPRQLEHDWRDELGKSLEDFERRICEQMESWRRQTSQTMLDSQQSAQNLLASLSSRLKTVEAEQPRVEVKLAQLSGGVKGARDEAVEQAKQLALLEERLQEDHRVHDEQIRARFSELGAELEHISAVINSELPGQKAKLEALVSEGFEEAVGLAVAKNGHQDEVETLLLDLAHRVFALERPCPELHGLSGQAAVPQWEPAPRPREEEAKLYGAVAKLQSLEEELLHTRSKLEKQEVHLASCQARLDCQEELQRALATKKVSLLSLPVACNSPAIQHSPRPAVQPSPRSAAQHSPRLAGQLGLQHPSRQFPENHENSSASHLSPRVQVQCFQISSDAEDEHEADGELEAARPPNKLEQPADASPCRRSRMRRLTPVTEIEAGLSEEEFISRQAYKSGIMDLPPAEPSPVAHHKGLPGTPGSELEPVYEHRFEEIACDLSDEDYKKFMCQEFGSSTMT